MLLAIFYLSYILELSRNAPGTLYADYLLSPSTSFSVTNTRGKQPAMRRETFWFRALESPVLGKN